jgi:hypothetical protein
VKLRKSKREGILCFWTKAKAKAKKFFIYLSEE